MKNPACQPAGLYDSSVERDACGIGFVADIEGRRTHTTLRQAVRALRNLAHRGAVSADGRSGDGAGVTTQIPFRMLARELRQRGVELSDPEDLALGMFFMPAEHEEQCRALVEEVLDQGGLRRIAWRDVPTSPEALGAAARSTMPLIRQLLIGRPTGFDELGYERKLYLLRRRIERRAAAAGIRDFYIPSLSHRTVVYKGLMVAPQLDHFFPDLQDPDFRTSIALFHQRYSTNTFPTWSRAQPFRMLGHNGEINTLHGNLNWLTARERELRSSVWGDDIQELLPIVEADSSDSAALDNLFELLVISGRSPLQAMMMLVPEAYQGRDDLDPDVLGFYEYHGCLMEPWDGPAGLVFTDGTLAAAGLDRNGLRPARYWVTANGTVIVASEAGVVPMPTELVVKKGRLGPGQMIGVDTAAKRLLDDATLKREVAKRRPYRAWVERHMVRAPRLAMSLTGPAKDTTDGDALDREQLLFGYGSEDLDRILAPMLGQAREPVGSMGDDTPIAALSQKPQTLYKYFRQRFAQVTNPPIDPLRERLVMSLVTATGPWGLLLDEREDFARLVEFPTPILSSAELAWVEELGAKEAARPNEERAEPSGHLRGFASRRLDARFPVEDGPEGLAAAVERLCREAEQAVDEGCSLLILSDRRCDGEWAPIPMLLATAAVHHDLIRVRRRMQVSLICDAGDVREDHHIACLIGYGATLVHPWLAYRTVAALARESAEAKSADDAGLSAESASRPAEDASLSAEDALTNYRRALEKGLLKIMSKMGIGPVASYQGAQIFEALGLDRDLVARYFVGTATRIPGIGIEQIAADVLAYHAEAFAPEDSTRARGGLPDRGVYRFRKDGERHAWAPQIFTSLHKAVRTGSRDAFERYSKLVEANRPLTIRDLLTWRKAAEPLALGEVEPAAEIAKRFTTQAMSHGAISSETHEAIAVAMNRIGGKSNSGEGGEDRVRFRRFEQDTERGFAAWKPRAGDWANSAIKQVASARFGVSAEYLMAAQEIEIKMAQGSKPGEGGQIPGHKVTLQIAKIRGAVPGVTLISPPPHHDIYSIEDLAQLIYDLERLNRNARICVKLVSGAGVGTVAVGVAKGYADSIQISGHDGGTGASPLSSVKHAGLPWELGLAETQQALVMNGLRDRVTLRVDGGLKTGRDVVLAALLGADEYGFGTASLVALGCIMARQCHLDTCPVGIATQRQALRAKFPGMPDQLVSFMLFVGEQVRHALAEIGARSVEEIVGRNDLLEERELDLPKVRSLDLSALLFDPDPERRRPRRRSGKRNRRPPEDALDHRVFKDCRAAVRERTSVERRYAISNPNRSVGARLAGDIAKRWGELPDGTFDLHFHGSAGQSFGVFCVDGMRLTLVGEAQDYVGKGMSGGEIVIKPPAGSAFTPHTSVILGNTVLYGATGGDLFAAGCAGERLAVRNSGARAVVEGCGDHGCEYMTGGTVVVLGRTGRNFGAGMSGGVAYVFDPEGRFLHRLNDEMVEARALLAAPAASNDELGADLLRLVQRHHQLTASARAGWILEHWAQLATRFYRVTPRAVAELEAAGLAQASEEETIEEGAVVDGTSGIALEGTASA
ncbi:MAG TPA: glutamate synthase large subunit [Thermoanaerobaculia bacterium]|nr:glutamate synthase large subunit [Thermoanaerobaculia bacterium]